MAATCEGSTWGLSWISGLDQYWPRGPGFPPGPASLQRVPLAGHQLF